MGVFVNNEKSLEADILGISLQNITFRHPPAGSVMCNKHFSFSPLRFIMRLYLRSSIILSRRRKKGKIFEVFIKKKDEVSIKLCAALQCFEKMKEVSF